MDLRIPASQMTMGLEQTALRPNGPVGAPGVPGAADGTVNPTSNSSGVGGSSGLNGDASVFHLEPSSAGAVEPQDALDLLRTESVQPRTLSDLANGLLSEVEGPQRRIEVMMDQMKRGDVDPQTPMAQWQLLRFQMEVQNWALQTETASKVVEHATSSTKTVLQTQA